MNSTISFCLVLALIAHLKPVVFGGPLRFLPNKFEHLIKEDLQNEVNSNSNFLDMRFESDFGKRSEFWQKFMKRSQEYGRDLNRLNKNDLKSIMKLKGKLTRVSDGIRFLMDPSSLGVHSSSK